MAGSSWKTWKYADFEDSVAGSLGVIGGEFKAPYQIAPESLQESISILDSINNPVVRYVMSPQEDITGALGILNGELV